MTSRTARAVSTAVIGGILALLYFRAGLFFWVGIVGWAAFAEAESGPSPLARAIGGTVFGACVAWLGIVASLLVPVSPDGWVWVPRIALAVALSLFLLEMGGGIELFSRRIARLLGYAALFGSAAILLVNVDGMGGLTGPHLSNPGIAVVIALVGGAIAGQLAASMTKALAGASTG